MKIERKQSQYAEDKELLFPKNSIICELGGGKGFDSVYFLKRGHRVVYIDFSKKNIEEVIKKAKKEKLDNKITVHRVDLEKNNIPMESESVDIVYSRLAMHFFTSERTRELVEDIFRVLKMGGKAYFAVKSPDDKYEMDFLRKTATEITDSIFDDKGKMKSRFTKKQWEDIINRGNINNFQINDYIEDFSGRNERTRSGTKKRILNEIVFTK